MTSTLSHRRDENPEQPASSPELHGRPTTISLNVRPLPVYTLPSLRPITKRCDLIRQSWPDAVPEVDDKNREAVMQHMLERLRNDDWADMSVARVTAAARVLFSPDFRRRSDLRELMDFYIAETQASSRSSFVSALMQVYLESYEPAAHHSRQLAKALCNNRNTIGAKWQRLFKALPEVLDPEAAHEALGKQMINMEDIWSSLKQIGLINPHDTGVAHHAHLYFLKLIGPNLNRKEPIHKLLNWLKPEGRPVKTLGAAESIDALLTPWQRTECDDDLRAFIAEKLIAMFGDPRLGNALHWASVSQPNKDLIRRWLTKEDMLFFTRVVDQTQNSPMWPPRRDFWLKLYEEKRIDEAWVAFSESAYKHATARLMKTDKNATQRRFGRQIAGGNRRNTSLLIMRVGNKIFVDGCHSYKTHVFKCNDKSAPELYKGSYNCETILRTSSREKAHNSIPSWKNWVLEQI